MIDPDVTRYMMLLMAMIPAALVVGVVALWRMTRGDEWQGE